MTKELITRLRCDITKVASDDVKTHELSWGGQDFEVELCDEQFLRYDIALQDLLKVARPVKKPGRKKRKKTSAGYIFENGATASDVPSGPVWHEQIGVFATEHGLDWSNKEVRESVRDWAIENGHKCSRTGVIPQATMEAYVEAH
jgi:hypothetical protein